MRLANLCIPALPPPKLRSTSSWAGASWPNVGARRSRPFIFPMSEWLTGAFRPPISCRLCPQFPPSCVIFDGSKQSLYTLENLRSLN
jgi:hypothetical protein